MVQNVQLFQTLHGVKTIHLVDHMSCGAVCSHLLCTRRCKDSTDIENVERSVHIQYLKCAYDTLKSNFPDMNIKLYLYTTDGLVEQVSAIPDALVLVDRFWVLTTSTAATANLLMAMRFVIGVLVAL